MDSSVRNLLNEVSLTAICLLAISRMREPATVAIPIVYFERDGREGRTSHEFGEENLVYIRRYSRVCVVPLLWLHPLRAADKIELSVVIGGLVNI
jgi:hypothetical protein